LDPSYQSAFALVILCKTVTLCPEHWLGPVYRLWSAARQGGTVCACCLLRRKYVLPEILQVPLFSLQYLLRPLGC
jgi:hypothetical protein